MFRTLSFVIALAAATPAMAEADKRFSLAAPVALEDSGLLDGPSPEYPEVELWVRAGG